MRRHDLRQQGHHHQKGFLLESLGLVLLIFSILALAQMNKKFEEDLDNEATRRGQALTTIRNFANDYLISYSSELLALPELTLSLTITTGAGVDVIIDKGGFPTIAELSQLGKAPPNLLSTAIGGGNYRIRIQKSPVGCSGSLCNLEGLVIIDKPYVTNGRAAVDYARLGIAAGVVGSDGAFSNATNPHILNGYAGKWSTPNPLSEQSGILAARFGYSSSIFSEFYKRDGSTSLTGAMNADNNAINNVSTLTATGKITGKNMVSTYFYNLNDTCDADDNKAFASGTSGAVMVCLDGQWKYANNPVSLGSPCAPDGTTGTSISNGETLICKGGIYIRLNNLIAKNVLVKRISVQDGDTFAKPVCEAGGTPDNSILINKTAVNMTTLNPLQAFEANVSTLGSSWIANIKLIDENGISSSANDYHIFATVNLECNYN